MERVALSIRPYARLLSMLGDQLIKNERIALVELIKNSYDADADRVEVRFEDFNEDMSHNEGSRIVVRDDGIGMTPDVVQTQWMNPAAPRKYLDKKKGRGRTQGKKRVIHGDKGIGRFAVLKLGKVFTVTTRPPGHDHESVLYYDFSQFDNEFVSDNNRDSPVFLDEIKIEYVQREPQTFPGTQNGTEIEIRNLRGVWADNIIEQLCGDVYSLTDPVSRIIGHEAPDSFEIAVVCNKERRLVGTDSREALKALIEDKAVLSIEGHFDSAANSFMYTIGDNKHKISLQDSKITGLWIWRQRFRKNTEDNAPAEPRFNCGDIKFQFHIFDFSRGLKNRYSLNPGEKRLLKTHRIYLYRDGMRVYPYGDPDDDWLNIDVTRGTGRAGNFFSNDQILGSIDITQEGNPGLRDKTSREGLIESGGAAKDLKFLVQTFLSYINQYPYKRYESSGRDRNIVKTVRDKLISRHLTNLKADVKKSGHQKYVREIAKIEKLYAGERRHLLQRAEDTEDLAGVGLSVEMASHDIMLLLQSALKTSKHLSKMVRTKARHDDIEKHVDGLMAALRQVAKGMTDVQSLFKSTRRRRRMLEVEPLLDDTYRLYQILLEQRKIDYRKLRMDDPPLKANTTDGVIMLVLVNLFDNACYWLDTVVGDKEIRVMLSGKRKELIFADNGPGIASEDVPYIFDPFYSGKGEKGRGLGLYIARQLLERHDYRIKVADARQNVLSGANFVISFKKEDV